jgi:indolepyruvate ferredoxin oxidoreductase beta subunit
MDQVKLLSGKPITIAILAMGGQGGGVLADWIVNLAEHAGWTAQSTSVPGVAQRTGATVYYVEIFPVEASAAAGSLPVLSLSPVPGQLDIVIAAELMEAGRAIQRGFVSPDRTTLIASSHRSYAVQEKAAPGNGIGDPNKVLDAGRISAKRFLCMDMAKLAEDVGSVISASLFGALAGAAVLPFEREAFEETVRRGGVGVETSLKAFAAGYKAVYGAPVEPAKVDTSRPQPEVPAKADDPAVNALLQRIRSDFPTAAQPMLVAGIKRLLDYQDEAYAAEYLDRLARLAQLDRSHGGDAEQWALTVEAARYVAVAMSYDDVIRVADLKTRGSRFERVRSEVKAAPGQILYTTEYFHPRLEEVCGTMPTALGRWVENSPRIANWLKPRIDKGRRARTGTLGWFLALWMVAGMKRFRRSLLRHAVEVQHMHAWLANAEGLVKHDYRLAVEVIKCRRLIKGYSDTHSRGTSKFDRIMAVVPTLLGQADAASRLARLREAALADEAGTQLDSLLQTLPSPSAQAPAFA